VSYHDGYYLEEEIGARSPGWFRIECAWCDNYTTGSEPVCEEWWHEHAQENHPRRYRKS
jgi:hypothetical protein